MFGFARGILGAWNRMVSLNLVNRSTVSRSVYRCALVIAIVSAAPESATADNYCPRIHHGTIAVDGMLSDWGRRAPTVENAPLRVVCAHDNHRLYVAVRARDRQLVRTSAARAGREDHLTVRLGQGLQLQVFPGHARIAPRYRINNRRARPRWLAIEDTRQVDGWSVELSVALDKIPGYSASVEALKFDAALTNVVRRGNRTIKRPARVRGKLVFQDRFELLQTMLHTANHTRSDVRLDTVRNIVGNAEPERIVWAGRVIGVLKRRYAYLVLPVASSSDVHSVRVVDFAGQGRSLLVAHFRQHGNGGSRDAIGVWRFDKNGRFTQVFAVEVRKQLGESVIANRWRIVTRKRQRGATLVIDRPTAVGWTQDTFREQPAQDMRPILQPWAPATRAEFVLEGRQFAVQLTQAKPR